MMSNEAYNRENLNKVISKMIGSFWAVFINHPTKALGTSFPVLSESFVTASVTNYHKLGGFKQNKCIIF